MSIVREVQRDCHIVQQINNDKFVLYATNDRMDIEKLENYKLDYFKKCTGISFTESHTILTDDVNSELRNTVQI